MSRKPTRSRKIINIILKHWKPTIGSLVILISVFLLIFKKIEVETLAAIVAAMVAAGYIPKTSDNGTE
jgi:O-antigen/teichoic acid export membrane protein